jgi:hypothetical protein
MSPSLPVRLAIWLNGMPYGRFFKDLVGKEVPAGRVVTGDGLDLKLGSRKGGGAEGKDSDENARGEHFCRIEVALEVLCVVVLYDIHGKTLRIRGWPSEVPQNGLLLWKS